MGASASDLDRSSLAKVSWSLTQHESNNPWCNYLMSRYGFGYSVTGVAASLALPRLMRKRLQDWKVDSFSFHFGENFLSFGRNLRSMSRESSVMFYGVDMKFGNHEPSWFYCKVSEWLLQLHKAILEPLSDHLRDSAGRPQDARFPGRAYFLGDEPPPAAVAANRAREAKMSERSATGETATAESGPKETTAAEPDDVRNSADSAAFFTHQLSVFLGNADGQIGLLTLPVPMDQVERLQEVLQIWEQENERPCYRGGQWWRSAQDFLQLREETVNLPDLLLLALEPETAMSLTPDWTWEKYPRGYGEVAVPHQPPAEEGDLHETSGGSSPSSQEASHP